jgi:hypothetical protein
MEARFDASDAADRVRKHRTWMCEDETARYFGRHLKWSLGGMRTIENHCRVHWTEWYDDEALRPVLCIGHCGEHLD